MKDPVCGMDIDPADAAASHEYGGQKYFFCNPSCLERFRADPERFLTPKHKQATAEITSAEPPTQATEASTVSTCPMHPEVRQVGPGSCPQCGMVLEPLVGAAPASKTEYVCPMHPEVVTDRPGSCPKCGMTLEPRTVTVEEEAHPELTLMMRRFWVSLILTAPVFLLAMSEMIPSQSAQRLLPPHLLAWVELILATPVVLWGGWPFFVRGWTSIVNRSPNMFTLISIGTGTAYLYSVAATAAPGTFPDSFRGHGGEVAVYFEAAAVITTLVLLGQVLELRARGQTSSE